MSCIVSCLLTNMCIRLFAIIHLMLLGISGLETAEISHSSLCSTSSELLGPGGLLPLVIDFSYALDTQFTLTSLVSLNNSFSLSSTLNLNNVVSQVEAGKLHIIFQPNCLQPFAVS